MNRLITSAAALIALSLTACGNEATLKCDEGFASEFKSAIEAGDVDKIMSLYHLKGVEESMKQMIKTQMTAVSNRAIARAEVGPVPEGTVTEYESAGKRYAINLLPTNAVTIHFASAAQGSETMTALVGDYEGSCRIATAAEVSN